MATLTLENNRFIFKCGFSERDIPRKAGFRWDPNNNRWFTPDTVVAARLREYASGPAKLKIEQSVVVSTPWSAPLPVFDPPLMAHQETSVKFILSNNSAYLNLKPGLGKTRCAVTALSILKRPAVYVTPPFLIRNVEAEFSKWAPRLKLSTYSGRGKGSIDDCIDVLVVPDSLLSRFDTFERVERFAKDRGDAVLIVDEAHRFKALTTQRTVAVFGNAVAKGIAELFSRRVFMSGTPMPNRPMELYPVLSKIVPSLIGGMSMFEYGKKYCAGFRDQFGWDFSGASNVEELFERIKPFMIKYDKGVLGLPPKIEEIFLVADNLPPRLTEFDRQIGKAFPDAEFLIKNKLATMVDKDGGELHLMTYRRLLGLAKVKPASDYVKSLMEETDENILIFAYHKEVIKELQTALSEYRPFVITGDTPSAERFAIVEKFQNEKARRLIIGNYMSMGVGFNITKATRVIFVEFDWVPGVNEQASDRAHRIGQENSVLVQYVVYQDSIDHAVIETLLRKQRATAHI